MEEQPFATTSRKRVANKKKTMIRTDETDHQTLSKKAATKEHEALLLCPDRSERSTTSSFGKTTTTRQRRYSSQEGEEEEEGKEDDKAGNYVNPLEIETGVSEETGTNTNLITIPEAELVAKSATTELVDEATTISKNCLRWLLLIWCWGIILPQRRHSQRLPTTITTTTTGTLL